jgi:hypothetical protein
MGWSAPLILQWVIGSGDFLRKFNQNWFKTPAMAVLDQFWLHVLPGRRQCSPVGSSEWHGSKQPIDSLVILYSSVSSSSIHPLSILSSSSIHPLFILYSSSIHPLFILYSSSIHPLITLFIRYSSTFRQWDLVSFAKIQSKLVQNSPRELVQFW